MDTKNTEVGSRITELRQKRGYTRERLSELADISVQFLADIEKGRKSMTVATLRRLSAALTVSTDYIVNGADNADSDDDNLDIISIVNSIPKENRKQAERILLAFAEAVNTKNVEKVP